VTPRTLRRCEVAEITVEEIKKLREMTGAGMMDCKKALAEACGDTQKAIEILRTKGLAGIEKRAGREAKEGIVDAYIHATGKVGVLVEVDCETDFVARSEDFKSFAHDVALQVAAAKPEFVSREAVPEDVTKREMAICEAQAKEEGKPENVIPRIVEGRMDKFYETFVLLEQPFIKDPDVTIEQLLGGLAAKVGEKIEIRRFSRFEIGEVSAEE